MANTPYYTKAEADAIEANLRRQYNYGASEYQGFLTIANTPTINGWYWATQIGTYTNAGGLVTVANKINMIEKDGTTFRLNVIDVPVTSVVDGFASNSTTSAGSANNDRLLSEKSQLNTVALDNKSSLTVGKNKFNKATANVGKSLDASGVLTTNATYTTSDYIPVVVGLQYTSNLDMRFVRYYDAFKIFLPSTSVDFIRTFTPPAGAVFARIPIYATDLNTFQLETGATATTYESYYKLIPSSELPNNEILSYVKANTQITKVESQILMVINNLFDKPNFDIMLNCIKLIEIEGNTTKKIYIHKFRCSNGGILQIDIYDEDGVYLASTYNATYTFPVGDTKITMFLNGYLTKCILTLNFDANPSINIGVAKGALVNFNYVDKNYVDANIAKYTENINTLLIRNASSSVDFEIAKKMFTFINIEGQTNKAIYVQRLRCSNGGILQIDLYDQDGIWVANIYNAAYTFPSTPVTFDFGIPAGYLTKCQITLDFSSNPTINMSTVTGLLFNKYFFNRLFIKNLVAEVNQDINISGGNYLAIGDSITAANLYQGSIASKFKMILTTHALGGVGLVGMVDGESSLAALTVAQVTGKKLITFFGGLNNRGSLQGTITDLYPTQNTICGQLNYALDKVLSLLVTANNRDCRVVCILPHNVGKYPYIDANGTDEYPTGSGQSLYTATRLMKQVCERKGIPTIDLFSDSGFNSTTWGIYTSNALATNSYTYRGEFASFGALPSGVLNDAARVVGVANAYIHNGTTWVLGATPYPYNTDQLHPGTLGHSRIANLCVAKIKSIIS